MLIKKPHIAIIGAGFSGAALCQRLINADLDVTLFEKSRGTGGRLASCLIKNISADLGAPFFTAKSSAFKTWLENQACIAHWRPNTHLFNGQQLGYRDFYVASPRQSAITRQLIQGATLLSTTAVSNIRTEQDNLTSKVILRSQTGNPLGSFDAAIITAPAQQAEPLLEAIPSIARQTKAIQHSSSWVLVTQVHSSTPLEKNLISGEHPILSRCVNDSLKPGRTEKNTKSIWVIEANESWSGQHLQCDVDNITIQMKEAFAALLPAGSRIETLRCHRWLYSRYNKTDLGFLWDITTNIGACGDWLSTGDVEGAWTSAQRMADELINHFTVSQN